jgi:hypothetical protein
VGIAVAVARAEMRRRILEGWVAEAVGVVCKSEDTRLGGFVG